MCNSWKMSSKKIDSNTSTSLIDEFILHFTLDIFGTNCRHFHFTFCPLEVISRMEIKIAKKSPLFLIGEIFLPTRVPRHREKWFAFYSWNSIFKRSLEKMSKLDLWEKNQERKEGKRFSNVNSRHRYADWAISYPWWRLAPPRCQIATQD